MLRFLRRLTFVVLALLFIPFALSNREPASLRFWPFEGMIEVPLYLLLLAVLALGILLGGLARFAGRLSALAFRRRSTRP